METKINIAEILKDKPQGTILYDYLHNIDVEFDNVEITEIETSIWCTRDKGGYNDLFGYSKLGTLRGWFDGLQILLPSRGMRDWYKFAWKKGDVLVSNDSDRHIIFKGFSKNDYTTFEGKHWISVSKKRYLSCLNMQNVQDYHIEDNKDAAQTYINTIEEHLGGKLNLETLEIEKAQPEFKDGDIVVTDAVPSLCYSKCIFILNGDLNTNENSANSYVFYNINNNRISFDVLDTTIRCRNIRLATEEEKKQLFSALKKKGKVWDSEHKMIVDLPKKCEFKPFDKVVVRDTEYSTWCADLFSHIDEDYRYACVGATWSFCIPYNEETAKLIGTTNNVEG